MNINIDLSKANTAKNKLYRGAGMVSGNNSSRLLLDYKYSAPERYFELIDHIFGENGIGVNHLKLEMGSDVNSTSGTEPCVTRFENEPCDVTRGAGYQLAADVKRRYPDVTLDMLFWSEPAWVTASKDVMDARYRWYKETLIAAYETYGLKFDYVSVNRNERDLDPVWIKYLALRLYAEADCPYDFAAIKIVAADEDNSWRIADLMAADEELRSAIDIVGSHYTSHATDNAKLMSEKYGKELWFSEGSAPMTYAKGASRFDGSGLSGLNSLLDIANRIVAMYPCGMMTLYEYQPVVSAYYDGVTFCHKQLITANEPWSGYYSLDCGYFMSLHFSRFFRKGWSFIDTACYNDSKVGGDGHALVDTVHSFMTACDVNTGDYSTVIVNSTDRPITYDFSCHDETPVNVWETRGSDSGSYDENYFRKTQTITPVRAGGSCGYSVAVNPFSMVTVSTLDTRDASRSCYNSAVMELPYRDDFDYGADIIKARGGAPRFTTDQGGAFEINEIDGSFMLVQQITPDIKAVEWGGTPNPTTSFGDDRWCNYSVSAEVMLTESNAPSENYIGIGLRCFLTCSGNSGYTLLAFEDRTWQLKRNGDILLSGTADFNPYCLTNLAVTAENNHICAYLDGAMIAEYTDKAVLSAGRAALYSSYNRNRFNSVEITPLDGKPYSITRFDDTDDIFAYDGEWQHETMCSFANYKRTLSTAAKGGALSFEFVGTGFALFGGNEAGADISVEIDGVRQTDVLPKTDCREVFFAKYGLTCEKHNVRISLLSEKLCVDGVEILS